ncbi:hypothetical protein OBBRIDRAFT_228341 [Obba rivulosa]|uniref:DUF6534 domain-containing protein n=1 Tax=Obba rivulosa TaxID=1052685 RepID=A0A8E2J730_9APHY|nr:hypothetical protein OBBRIDRAFT_228341 [Obba rivulosa]
MSSVHLDGTLGVIQIASMVTSVAYGITTLQSYTYFHRSGGDPVHLKIVIGLLWVLDTLHQCFLCHVAYSYSVTNYGNWVALTWETWSVAAALIVGTIMNLIVRSFFYSQVWKLSGKRWLLASPIILCSLGECVAMLDFGEKLEPAEPFAFLHPSSDAFYATIAFSIAADILLAVSQVALLWSHRSEFSRINSAIRIMVTISINTGLLSTFCAILMCISYVALPNTFVWAAFDVMLPKLLLNALLSSLNQRKELREIVNGNINQLSFPLSALPSSTATTGHDDKGQHLGPVLIEARSEP